MSAHALRSSSALQRMKSTMSGWSALSTTILAARRVLPPDLMTPAEASAARMKDTGPEAVPPPPSRSREERRRERFTPARAPFENDPLLAVPVEDRVHGVVDGEDEAGRALRLRLDAHVEPDRAVEGSLLVEEEMGQLVGERRPIARRGEVALRLAPLADGAHHAADQLPHAALPLGRAERAAEVLRDDDVGRELRPGPRHLDVALLEDGLAALAGDDRRADLPLDRLVRIGARRDEAPRDRQAAPRRALRRTRP